MVWKKYCVRNISRKVRGIYAWVDTTEIVRVSTVKPQAVQTHVTKKWSEQGYHRWRVNAVVSRYKRLLKIKKGFGYKNSECVNINIPSGWVTFRVSISSNKMIRKGRRTHCRTGSWPHFACFFFSFFLANRGNNYIKNYISIHAGTFDRCHNQHNVVIAAAEPRVWVVTLVENIRTCHAGAPNDGFLLYALKNITAILSIFRSL